MRGCRALLGIFLLSGFLFGARSEARYEAEAHALHRQGVLDYRAGRYELALSSFKAVVREYAGSEAVDASRYMAGLCLYRLKRYKEGLDYLKRLFEKPLPPEFFAQARALAGECWLGLKDHFQAAGFLFDAHHVSEDSELRFQTEKKLREEILPRLSMEELEALKADFASKELGYLILYLLGEQYLKAKDHEGARRCFEAVVKHFPESSEAGMAQLRLEGLKGPSRRVGLLLPMSGEFSRFAQEVQSGIEHAFLELSPPGVRLELYDTASDPARAAEGAVELIAERGVDCIIGPISSREAFAVAPIANQHQVVFILPTATEPQLSRESPFIFQLNAYPYFEMEMITEYALSVLGMHHFGVIYPSNPRGRGLAEAFCEAVKSHAGTVEAKISIPEADPTLKDRLYPLTRKRLDGIFIPASAEEIVMVAPQLRYCGVKSRILGVEEFMDPILREHGADYIEGAVFAGPARIEPIDEARFYESYRARNRREPSELAGLGYDAGRLIFSQLKGEYSRSSLRDRIEKMGGYQGICGRLSWQHPKDAYKIYTIKDGLIEELKG